MAPELLSENIFTEKSDVYSYGMVLWEIYARCFPWTGLKAQQIMYQVTIKLARPEIPSSMPDDVRELMQRSWAPEPSARPSFAEIARELRATTPKRPSSTSEIRPWSSPRAADERQGSTRSMFARALSNFRSTSSLDVGGDKDDDGDDGDAAVAQEAPAVTEAVRASPIEEGAATGKIRVLYEPMRTWYGAPGARAERSTARTRRHRRRRELEVLRACNDGLPRRSGRGTGTDCSGARARRTSSQGGDAVEVVESLRRRQPRRPPSATEESATEEAGDAP